MLYVKKVHSDAQIPRRANVTDAGYDLSSVETLVIPPASMAIVSTGLVITVPHGTYGRIAPRSGLAVKHSICVGAGVVDQGYRGEVKVVLFNHHKYREFRIHPGDRIAQLVLECIQTPPVIESDVLNDVTDRGSAGFGSTGVQ
jgi:dUTP pyrophosphatase